MCDGHRKIGELKLAFQVFQWIVGHLKHVIFPRHDLNIIVACNAFSMVSTMSIASREEMTNTRIFSRALATDGFARANDAASSRAN